jgi:hypothetical protein
MLSTAELQAHLERLTYRRGWFLRIYEGRFEGHHIVIQAELEDSFNPGRMVVLDVHSMLPPMRDTDQLEEWIAWRLARMEVHECREWLKRDGAPIFDPHAEGAEHDL